MTLLPFLFRSKTFRKWKTKITLNINVETEDKSESCKIYDDKLNYLQARINHEWSRFCFQICFESNSSPMKNNALLHSLMNYVIALKYLS